MNYLFRQTTWLYVAVGDDGVILYVGISHQPKCRIKDHKRLSLWYKFSKKIDLIEFPSRADAACAETEYIKKYQPKYNLILNPKYKRETYIKNRNKRKAA